MPAEQGEARPGKSGPPGSDWRKGLREAGPLIGLGMQMALTMVIFVGGGYALDQWFNTRPWLTIVGGALGIVALFIHLFRLVRQLDRRNRGE